MKNTVLATCAIAVLFMAGCKKNDNTTVTGNAGGTWTFKSISYQAPNCDTTLGALNAIMPASGSSKGREVAVDFYNTTPTAGGTFNVIKGNSTLTTNNQVEVGITDVNGAYYISTGSGNQTVSVTVNSGKVAVTGTGITLVNLNNPADSANLTFSIQQTD